MWETGRTGAKRGNWGEEGGSQQGRKDEGLEGESDREGKIIVGQRKDRVTEGDLGKTGGSRGEMEEETYRLHGYAPFVMIT